MKNCMTCGYMSRDLKGYYCCNPDSDQYTQYMDTLHRCPYWGKEDDTQEDDTDDQARQQAKEKKEGSR